MAKHAFEALTEQLLEDPDVRKGYEQAQRNLRLGAALKLVRESKNWSQRELQKETGIDQADISRLEAGNWDRGPTLDTWVRLAAALGVVITIPDLDVKVSLTVPSTLEEAVVLPHYPAVAG
jgi:transcriptional regulator with XRE-family HTH domain